ncbi:hypothetical protein SMACR_07251 [Sordaria macrospora]|uniref:Large ribosomal subunit protein bL32m n=2 Tax=Sordaria macrospora TaxID=5147 RepID=F7W840_SORMK|nr:uncharacterized protein SMAC_07251 [Sordaria macrospora k-hell]KAA8630250.1 hypothetical protein SMACR_07251 [Sordaria macrospora]KAH7635679.1 hypothetical protein B0T09DRAFT_329432 [Sordaria sp. MPI-SDFR-AT-0083]WPJ64174.1 hypothetical protein SMAC4_07251 [Sordaria macrospora]CCC13685.1 unnamed protein product [Sordaria macrospora k-hell]
MAAMTSAAAPALRLFNPSTFFQTLRTQRFGVPALSFAVPAAAISLLPSIPSLLEDIWESILRAVPKKKTSHMKKRHRQMAGKALKDVTHLNRCPACGGLKRMHHLCSNCLGKLKGFMDREGGSNAKAY